MRCIIVALAALLSAAPALAQNQWGTPSGPNVPGAAALCLNSSGKMVPQWSPSGVWQCAGTTAASDVQSQAFQGVQQMTVGTVYPPQRSVGILATVGGNVTFQFADSSILTLAVFPGWQTFPFAVVEINASTATATYWNLK